MDNILVDKIVKNCVQIYEKLPKTGKPSSTEYTILSCVIKLDEKNNFEVISLGTGTKCIGAIKMCPKGQMLNDSHAEVLARRGFLLYLYENISNALEEQNSIFTVENKLCKLKDGIKFAFYSSQMPCGDASILPMSNARDSEMYGDIVTPRKRKTDDQRKSAPYMDIHRTGAKCLPHSEQDPKGNGMEYHLLSQVRTKPGRGDRTLSVSCSDKISRWVHLGLQGSLIGMLLQEPIYISYFIFGAGIPYSEESLNRAILTRNNTNLKIECVPKFFQSSVKFKDVKSEKNNKPAPGSIVWINLIKPISEVAVQGKKLGVTKKTQTKSSFCLKISKASLFKSFLSILQQHKELRQTVLGEMQLNEAEYDDIKSKSKNYNDKWLFIKENFFKLWTIKPKMWNFKIDNF